MFLRTPRHPIVLATLEIRSADEEHVLGRALELFANIKVWFHTARLSYFIVAHVMPGKQSTVHAMGNIEFLTWPDIWEFADVVGTS